MARQAKADRTAQIEQVLVVMASRDVPDGTAITADELTMQAFPSDFVPHGAVANPEQAVGKYTTTRITKGQIVLSNQLSDTLRAGNLSLSVPCGMEAVALPLSDLMSMNGAIKAGDHVDILLTIDLKEIQLKSADPKRPLNVRCGEHQEPDHANDTAERRGDRGGPGARRRLRQRIERDVVRQRHLE